MNSALFDEEVLALQVHMGYNFLRQLLQYAVWIPLLYNYLCYNKGKAGC